MTSNLQQTDKHNENEIDDIFNLKNNQVSSAFSLKTDENKMSEKDLPNEQAMDEHDESDEEATESINVDTTASSDLSATAGLNRVQMNASTSSNGSTESTVSCRICKGHGGKDLVLSPCKCKGRLCIIIFYSLLEINTVGQL